VELSFPLLNPRDRIEFSILVDRAFPKYEVLSRVAGVEELKLTRAEPRGAFSFRRIPWTTYVVFATMLFFLLVLIVGAAGLAREFEIQRLWVRKIIRIPDPIAPSELRIFLTQLFLANKISLQTAPIWPILEALPENRAIDAASKARIAMEVEKALNDMRDSFKGLTACLVIFLVSLGYVMQSVFKAFT
jgi:hypothetical protein